MMKLRVDIVERSFDNTQALHSPRVMETDRSPSEYETKPLAFVDVETTGLSPSRNDIAEIGVVTVDGARVERWSTLIKAPSRRELALAKGVVPDDLDNAPTFAD